MKFKLEAIYKGESPYTSKKTGEIKHIIRFDDEEGREFQVSSDFAVNFPKYQACTINCQLFLGQNSFLKLLEVE